ncbi:MAG: DNA repair protein RecO [Cyclobacteriaceae bacterium]|nr:DNA repair protein RecO [Cyclobacteriaceae bacterium]
MLHKTRGVVFRLTKYGETSIIVSIFTELFGLQSYIVNSVRTKSSKNKIALFQPLTLLDLVVYHRENADILRIKEVKVLYAYQTIHHDIRKSAIAMFLNEFLNRSVKDQSHAEEICEFLIQSLKALDEISQPENFHLIFLIRLSRFLGFGPQTTEEVLGVWLLSNKEESTLKELLVAEYDTLIQMNYTSRKNLLEALLRFYSTHIDNFGEIKSIQVLKEMFN